jgi:DNA end-binding protein Ku
MKTIWTGAIGFGLVNIPIKLYSATQESVLDLDMLDKKDHSNIHFKRVNEKTGKEVSWENIVKGYKIDDRYVILTDKDFETANAVKTKLIEITSFVKTGEIDTMFYETPYYTVPEKSGIRAYALFREALLKTNKAAVGTFVMRNKETLAVLSAHNDVIILNRIRFQQEIRNTEELDLPKKTEVKATELKMAVSLIDQLSNKFDISSYKDTYSEQLMKVIKSKAKGTKAPTSHLRVVHNRTTDLMSQLKASLKGKTKKAS